MVVILSINVKCTVINSGMDGLAAIRIGGFDLIILSHRYY
jgi:hypothetical protein